MTLIRKHLFPLAAVVLFSFATIMAAEDFHHHEGMEGDDDCAFCSFILTASSSTPSLPVVPLLLPSFVVFALVVLQVFFASAGSVSPRGRSPPQIL